MSTIPYIVTGRYETELQLRSFQKQESDRFINLYGNKYSHACNCRTLLLQAYPQLQPHSCKFSKVYDLFSEVDLIEATVRVADSIGLLAITRVRKEPTVRFTFTSTVMAELNSNIFNTCNGLTLKVKIVNGTLVEFSNGMFADDFLNQAFDKVVVWSREDLRLAGLKTYHRARFLTCRQRKESELHELLGADPSLGYLILS